MKCKWIVILASMSLTTLSASSALAGQAPCTDPGHRQFDFWLGQWRVETGDGQYAGDNRITQEQAGCLLIEQWKGSQGGGGTSLNFYSRETDTWRQVWVSPGVLIDIVGGLEDGSMVMRGSISYQAQAASRPFRAMWTPLEDGRVRQFFEEERPDDAGVVDWRPWFEGFYSRVATDGQ